MWFTTEIIETSTGIYFFISPQGKLDTSQKIRDLDSRRKGIQRGFLGEEMHGTYFMIATKTGLRQGQPIPRGH